MGRMTREQLEEKDRLEDEEAEEIAAEKKGNKKDVEKASAPSPYLRVVSTEDMFNLLYEQINILSAMVVKQNELLEELSKKEE